MTGIEHLPDDEQVKLILMCLLDECVRTRYRTVQEAADRAGLNPEQLSRLRHADRHRRRYSIPWLIRVGQKLGVTVRIDGTLPEPRTQA